MQILLVKEYPINNNEMTVGEEKNWTRLNAKSWAFEYFKCAHKFYVNSDSFV